MIRRERNVKVATTAGAPTERIMNVLFVPVRDDPNEPIDAVTIIAVDNTREAHSAPKQRRPAPRRNRPTA